MIPYKNEYYFVYPTDERLYPGIGLGGPGSGYGFYHGLGFGEPGLGLGFYPGIGLGGPGSGYGYFYGLGLGAPGIPHPQPPQGVQLP
ncbi:hypothetical protein V7089_07845, partial [Neobacillus drentensis]